MSDVSFRNLIKVLLRTRSIRFASDMMRQSPDSKLASVRWSDRDVFYRSGTADPFVLNQILFRSGRKAEYYVPPGLKPKTILDIGSNIGASILYFHERFPGATIFGFEPHPDTFRVLQKNVEALAGVAVFNYGLGATNQRITARADQVNFGAFNTRGEFKDRGYPESPVECEIRRLDDVLRELGIAQVDLIKVDCEGAEADVFSTLPDEVLNRCQWIVGEFHDHTGFAVLARLASHFHLDLKKKMFRSRFRFHACNVNKMQEMPQADLDALQR